MLRGGRDIREESRACRDKRKKKREREKLDARLSCVCVKRGGIM